MSKLSAREKFLTALHAAVNEATLVKLTLGKYRGADATLRNLFVRPVTLQTGPQLTFVWRHATRDITKNHPPTDALRLLETLIGVDFLDAHLFTPAETIQFSGIGDGSARLSRKVATTAPAAAEAGHDREKVHLISPDLPWLRILGVTNDQGRPREGQSAKFRQINKFAELLTHLLVESGLVATGDDAPGGNAESWAPLRVVDMGSGKGYLTFAVRSLLGSQASIRGVETRPELVTFCNEAAVASGFSSNLSFVAGAIAETPLSDMDVLIALHACDTATDDALAKGIMAGARLLVVAPCCQKELRAQLTAPGILKDALRHGIFQERQAEFVTDALRAALLEWAGYRTKVFEFISTEHTAKNLMIAAIKESERGSSQGARAERLRAFARFYGIKTQALAELMGFSL